MRPRLLHSSASPPPSTTTAALLCCSCTTAPARIASAKHCTACCPSLPHGRTNERRPLPLSWIQLGGRSPLVDRWLLRSSSSRRSVASHRIVQNGRKRKEQRWTKENREENSRDFGLALIVAIANGWSLSLPLVTTTIIAGRWGVGAQLSTPCHC
jgi:hypothetical protein